MSELRVKNWVVIISGITKSSRYVNVVGVYETEKEARREATKVKRGKDYLHFRKYYDIIVHVRPNYEEQK